MSENGENERTKEIKEIKHVLQDAGRYKLLSREEEFQLISLFQWVYKNFAWLYRMNFALSKTRKKIQQEQMLIYIYVCLRLKQWTTKILVGSNLRLVIKTAIKYYGKGIPITDLVSEGSDGLIHAVEKFDLSRGLKLSTYATQWIRQRIGRSIESKSRLVKVSPTMLAKITRLKKIYRAWSEKYGYPPTAKDLSEEFLSVYGESVSKEEAEAMGRMDYDPVSLDEETGEDDNIPRMSYIAEITERQPEELIEKSADSDYVFNELLYSIEEDDAKFIRLRYGCVDDRKERTEKELAALYRCSVAEVKARIKRVLADLEKHASLEKVNVDFLCDVYIDTMTSSDMGFVLDYLKLDIHKLTVLPAKVASKVDRIRAEEIVRTLFARGIGARIV